MVIKVESSVHPKRNSISSFVDFVFIPYKAKWFLCGEMIEKERWIYYLPASSHSAEGSFGFWYDTLESIVLTVSDKSSFRLEFVTVDCSLYCWLTLLLLILFSWEWSCNWDRDCDSDWDWGWIVWGGRRRESGWLSELSSASIACWKMRIQNEMRLMNLLQKTKFLWLVIC